MVNYNDNLKYHDCLSCSHSFVTDEDDELHCPFRNGKPVDEDEWCEDWN